MENSREIPESQDVVMANQEAEEYAGAIWRKPTVTELEEIAQFYAEDQVNGDLEIRGEDPDIVERAVSIAQCAKEIFGELQNLTMVQDFVNFEAQMFYTFYFIISAGKRTGKLSFEDGLGRLLKHKGLLRVLDQETEILFQL